VDPVKLFWVVVLGVGGGERSFAELLWDELSTRVELH